MSATPTSTRMPFQARIRKSPFFDACIRHGCHSFGVYNRTYIAMGFSDPVSEYWDLLNKVVLWPASGERQLEITGPDAARFTQLLTCRNLSQQQVGQCKYVLVTADDGGIVNDPICLKLGPNHFWLSAADSDIWLYARGVNALAQMDVELSDPDVSVLQIQGPRSLELMQVLVGEAIAELRYYWSMETEIAGCPVVVSRTGWSSEWGYEIYLRDAGMGDVLFEAIVEAGEAFELGLGVVSQARRIEGGMLSYGADMDLRTNPFEIGLKRLVELEAPLDYIGRAALERLGARPPERMLCGIAYGTEPGPPLRSAVPVAGGSGQHAGVDVGAMTSAAWSPRLECNVGLAILPTAFQTPDAPVALKFPNQSVPGVTKALPFVPRRTVST